MAKVTQQSWGTARDKREVLEWVMDVSLGWNVLWPFLAACHHLSPFCHPDSGAGLCQLHGPPCLGGTGWEWSSISGVSWASVLPGQSPGAGMLLNLPAAWH